MARKTALVVCPGRGTYNKNDLGYLARHHGDKAGLIGAIDAARLATYQAIARLEDGAPADREIAMAKVLANHAYKWTTLTGQQIHGGIGFMEEYDLQMWTRRAKVAELKFGTSAPHREVFAQSMGLL